jgi:bifunctional non-homologous end joining protein LigD
MALEQYNQKRRFNETPEPQGKLDRGEQHRFVVQKHRASHLHYDFRLEMDGLLKSWAVPKGPSLDPGDKRLAMQVEDHPVSYFHFEGKIPEGNYGAGTVMVWDTGTWQPLGDEHEMLRKGDLKFKLNGKKLKGEFVLAKMRSRRPGSKGTEWLLIKKKDDATKSGFDIDKLDYSVLTDRSLAEIAGDQRSAEWESNRKAAVRKGAKWLLNDEKQPAERAVKRTSASARKATSTKSARSAESKQPATQKSAVKKAGVKKKTRRAA